MDMYRTGPTYCISPRCQSVLFFVIFHCYSALFVSSFTITLSHISSFVILCSVLPLICPVFRFYLSHLPYYVFLHRCDPSILSFIIIGVFCCSCVPRLLSCHILHSACPDLLNLSSLQYISSKLVTAVTVPQLYT